MMEANALTFCWRLERGDGAGVALTSSDRDMALGETVYRSAPGVTPSAIVRTLGLEADSGEVAGAVSADCLSEDDLTLGRWNGASVSLFAIDWMNPAESIPLLAGNLGEVSIDGDSFAADLQGAASKLSAAPCPSTSAECRAAFGDPSCGIDLAGRSMRATCVSASGNRVELDRAVDQSFLLGRARFLGGGNCGSVSTILGIEGTTIQLRDRPRAGVEAGIAIELREGCDKSFATCVSRFSNGINFRGEPHLPGTDLLTRYPGR